MITFRVATAACQFCVIDHIAKNVAGLITWRMFPHDSEAFSALISRKVYTYRRQYS